MKYVHKYKTFSLQGVEDQRNVCDGRFVERIYADYITYHEEFMSRNVPEGCCIWEEHRTEIKQNLYCMQYTIKKVDDKHSEVIEKVTICQPDIYECRGSLIAVMTRLLSDNAEPRYYYVQNELVTERLIYLGEVCVYRDFLWAIDNPDSFMRKDQYRIIDKKLPEAYKGTITLHHEFIAVLRNYTEGVILPSHNERPSGPRIAEWPSPTFTGSWRPFWPETKDDIIHNLERVGLFDFYPTTIPKLRRFRDKSNIPKSRLDDLTRMSHAAVSDCVLCEQDLCVWGMNCEKIIRNVHLMKGGIWRSMYSDQQRREIGCRLGIYIMNNGYGRHWDKKKFQYVFIKGYICYGRVYDNVIVQTVPH